MIKRVNIKKYPFYLLVVLLLIVTPFVYAELLVYEGFEYAITPLGNQDGGFGFDGGWYKSITLPGLSGLSVVPLNTDVSLSAHAVFTEQEYGIYTTAPQIPKGGHIYNDTGLALGAYRFLDSSAFLDMNSGRDFYLSWVFRINECLSPTGLERLTLSLNSLDQNYQKSLIGISIQSQGSLVLDMKDGKVVSTELEAFELDNDYFIVVKIVANDESSSSNTDIVYVKIYDMQTPVEPTDFGFIDSDWTVIADMGTNYSDVVNVVGIDSSEGACYGFDELRVGTKWSDAVSPNPLDCDCLVSEFDKTDVNRDYLVDLNDFAALAKNWLQCNDPLQVECDEYRLSDLK